VAIGPIGAGWFGATTFELELPELGTVPFETGRRESDDVALLARTVGQLATS
jgi:hypothetical protein